MAERENWVDAFASVEISRRQLMEMSEAEFQNHAAFLIDSGLAPPTMEDEALAIAISESLRDDESPPSPPEISDVTEPPNNKSTSFNPADPKDEIDQDLALAIAMSMEKDDGDSNYKDIYKDNPPTEDSPPPPITTIPYVTEPHVDRLRRQVYSYIPPQPPRRETQSKSGEIRSAQNEEYEMAQMLAVQKEIEEMERKEALEEQIRIQKENEEKEKMERISKIEEKKELIMKLKDEVPPEPANGIQIAINLPSKRFIRKFLVTSLCDELFNLLAAEDDFFDEDGTPKSFTLSQPMGGDIVRGKTFQDQGITKRSLLNVQFE